MTTTVERPASPTSGVYLPTDISPETVFQAIGRLRKEARDEIDRLIALLDLLEDCDQDSAIDDRACDEEDTGIGDYDGLLEQVGTQDWQRGGMA